MKQIVSVENSSSQAVGSKKKVHKLKACPFMVGKWRNDPLVNLDVKVQMAT